MFSSEHRFIDGPLVIRPRGSDLDLVERMALDLLRLDAFRWEAGAFRTLIWCGKYRSFDVARLLNDARQVAMSETVARVMSEESDLDGPTLALSDGR